MAKSSDVWFAVRCVFRASSNKPWGPYDLKAGESAYEERITIWRAESEDKAIALAQERAHLTEDEIEVEYLGIAQSYRISEEPAEGTEVFSLVRKSTLDRNAYLDTFFDTDAEYQRTTSGPEMTK